MTGISVVVRSMTFLLFALMVVSWIVAMVSFVRAARFAKRHEDQLHSIVKRSGWWLLLLRRNGYGTLAEPERRHLALWFAGSLLLFFLSAGILFFTAPRPQATVEGRPPDTHPARDGNASAAEESTEF